MSSLPDQSYTIPILGMQSQHCEQIIDKALQQLSSISSHTLQFSNSRLQITVSKPEALQDAVNTIRQLGYEVGFAKKILPVLDMNCASCANSIESTLQSQRGVISAAVNFATATLSLEYLPTIIDLPQIKNAVQQAGFDLLIEQDNNQTDSLEEIHQKKFKQLQRNSLWATALSLPLMVISMFFMDMPYATIIMWLLSTPVVLYFGRNFFINAWKQTKNRSANMDTLVAMGTGVAYIFSVFNSLFPNYWLKKGLVPHLYFEAAAVIICFILLGRLLEEKAKGNTASSLKKLLGFQPKTATIVDADGQQREILIEALRQGDTVLVRPGEKIAVDGLVLDGNSYVDQSMLSGESLPLKKNKDDKVYAGTINQKGSLIFLAQKLGSETVLAHIIKMVQEAQASKAPVQKLVDTIASIFVPTVFLIALIALAAWIFFGGENGVSQGLMAFATVLIIACPCALGLATPTAIMVGIGKAAEKGILIKDALSLELTKKVTAVVLDKTGTITQGKPQVTDSYWRQENSYLKQIVLSIEQQSEHPLATALVNHFEGSSSLALDQFESISGKGVSAQLQGKNYLIGNQRLLLENKVTLFDDLLEKANQWTTEAKTVIWFSEEKQSKAVIAIADQIKATSLEAISQLRAAHIKVHILSGDNESITRELAQKTGIRNFKAEILPQQKAAYIKELQTSGEIVAMVGDGINDSAALAQADVSIAMGTGSDIAMEVANMTLISSDLNKIPQAIKLSKQTVSTIKQNLFWASCYNLLGIPLAAGIMYPINGFLLNPMLAAAAMALSSLSVLSNSLRLKWKTDF